MSALPTINVPQYSDKIPSTGKEIKYRPFLVKEEKVLLIALESEDEEMIGNAIFEVLKSCIQTKGIKIEELSTFDIEYLFLKIRAKSVGEQINLTYTCPDDGTTKVDVTIEIDDIKVEKDPKHNPKIMLDPDNNVGLIMKYPGMKEFVDISVMRKSKNTEEVFNTIAACVHSVFNAEEVWESKSVPKKDIIGFLENLTSKQFEMINEFYETMPVLRHKVKVTNPNTNVEHEFVIEGLQDFFA